jgi:hypothetical protein
MSTPNHDREHPTHRSPVETRNAPYVPYAVGITTVVNAAMPPVENVASPPGKSAVATELLFGGVALIEGVVQVTLVVGSGGAGVLAQPGLSGHGTKTSPEACVAAGRSIRRQATTIAATVKRNMA